MNPDAPVQELDDWSLVCQLLPRLAGAGSHSWVHCGGPAGFPDAAVLLPNPAGPHWPPAVPSRRRSLAFPTGRVGVTSRRWPLFQRLRAAEQWLRLDGRPALSSAIPPRRCTPRLPLPVPSMPTTVQQASAAWAPTGGSTSASTWRICSATSSRSPMSAGGDLPANPRGPRRCVAGGSLLWHATGYRSTSPGPAAMSWCGSTTGPCRCGISRDDRSGWPRNCATIDRTDPKWPTVVRHDGSDYYPGRLVAVKRDRWAACLERRELRKRASKLAKAAVADGSVPGGVLLRLDRRVGGGALDAAAVLSWYRCRWQIEISHPDYPSSYGLYRGDWAA